MYFRTDPESASVCVHGFPIESPSGFGREIQAK